MAKIAEDIEQRIKAAAKIRDVLEDRGVELFRKGRNLLGLCPFHADRHIGSFVVNEQTNSCWCYSCEKGGDPIKVLMTLEGMTYPDALRYLAAMYNIIIDDGPVPTVAKREPRKPEPPKPLLYWSPKLLKPYFGHADENVLLKWMYSLPWDAEKLAQLKVMVAYYMVGTVRNRSNYGWVLFPMVDMERRLLDGKMMAYNPDGHRKKDVRYTSDWITAKLRGAERYDETKYHTDKCLFGLHLVPLFPDAEICIVESEKTALICSAFSDPNERLWLATCGKGYLKPTTVMPLIEMKKDIVLYPDMDAYPKWTDFCKNMAYKNMSVTPLVKKLHIASDGPKADIADIIIRRNLQGIEETETDRIMRRLGIEKNEALEHMIETFGLRIDK